MESKNIKLKKSLETLKKALENLGTVPLDQKELLFLSVAKAFETAVEYSWRELQQKVAEEGCE